MKWTDKSFMSWQVISRVMKQELEKDDTRIIESNQAERKANPCAVETNSDPFLQ